MNKKFSFYLFNAFLDFKSKCKYLQVDLVTLKIEKVCLRLNRELNEGCVAIM